FANIEIYMIRKPPSRDQLIDRPYTYVSQHYPTQAEDYRPFYEAMDNNGRYLHYDEFRFRVPKDLNVDVAWALTKLAGSGSRQPVMYLGAADTACTFMSTPTIQKTMTLVDQSTTSAMLEWTIKQIGEEQHLQYLFNGLFEEEAISSSQLEGAATTTLVAKDMLKRKREPRSPDEKMILGNFKMMRFAWEQRKAALTPALIKDLHKIGVEGINDE